MRERKLADQVRRADAGGPDDRERVDALAVGEEHALGLDPLHERAQPDRHAPALQELVDVGGVGGERGRHDTVAALEDGDGEVGRSNAGVAGKQRLARHLDQLRRHFHARDAAADDGEREQASPLRGRFGLLRHLEQLHHPRAERHGVDDGLESPGVLPRAGHVVVVRDASHGDDERVVGLHQVVVEMHLVGARGRSASPCSCGSRCGDAAPFRGADTRYAASPPIRPRRRGGAG